MRLIQGYQRAIRQLISEIESSKENHFFIKHIAAGSIKAKWYLIQVDMYQSDLVAMKDYDMYRWRCYIKHNY